MLLEVLDDRSVQLLVRLEVGGLFGTLRVLECVLVELLPSHRTIQGGSILASAHNQVLLKRTTQNLLKKARKDEQNGRAGLHSIRECRQSF